MFIFILSVLCFLQKGGNGLDVKLDYSFRVPEKFGVADVDSVGCCPHIMLPDNVTHGMVVPTMFGIGVQKGGTTTLHEKLVNHPQMHKPVDKELHYLDHSAKSFQGYLRKWHWNIDRWTPRFVSENGTTFIKSPLHGRLFEISPSYLFIPIAACKAKVISPMAKFIVLLREPASRSYSGFTYTWHKVHHAKKNYPWMQDFLKTVKSGIKEIALNPKCDFQTGRQLYTYNDCARCLAIKQRSGQSCEGRQYVFVDSLDGDYTCNMFGVELILRGFYAAQLSWWFTLFDPSQFRIYNSVDYFKDPLPILEDIADFLELTVPYSQEMLDASEEKANPGYYLGTDEEELELAKSLLNDYYRRPNLELYKLLHETGHTEFTPFDKALLEVDTLDCMDPDVTSTGVCGDEDFLRYFDKDDELKIPLPKDVVDHISFSEDNLIQLKESWKQNTQEPRGETSYKVLINSDSAGTDQGPRLRDMETYTYTKITSYYSFPHKSTDLALYLLFTIVLSVLLIFGIRYRGFKPSSDCD